MNKQIKTEIIIKATPEKVWKILTDFSRYPEWNPFIIGIEGKQEKGAKLKNTLRNGEKLLTFYPVIQEIEPGRHFSWLGSLFVRGLFDGLHTFQIEEADTHHVKLIHSETFSGFLSSPILKKIGPATRDNFVQMNLALKNRAESI